MSTALASALILTPLTGKPETFMANAGFVYVLINPSMPGLLKIGMTSRDPEGVTAELSFSTGVPTPFVLAYQRHFDDCASAERAIRLSLERQGLRPRTAREFFRAPLHQVIEALASLADDVSAPKPYANSTSARASPVGRVPSAKDALIADLLAEARAEAMGSKADRIRDPVGAFRCYEQAAKLGSTQGHKELALCYRIGMGVEKNVSLAVRHYRQAGQLGLATAYSELADLFVPCGEESPSEQALANARACWVRFFTLILDEDYPPDEDVFDHDDQKNHFLDQLDLYLEFVRDFGVDKEVTALARKWRDEWVNQKLRLIQIAREQGYERIVSLHMEELDIIEEITSESTAPSSSDSTEPILHEGVWWLPVHNGGWLRWDDGRRVWVPHLIASTVP